MAKLVVSCPSCEGDLRVTRLACQSCGTNLDGSFEVPVLLQLPAEDLAFIVEFVRASGSLKAMATLEGRSYPTVRNRLDQIIDRVEELERGVQKRRHEILDALEKGKLSSKEAERELRKVGL
ncbi:MAG: hypothetical protein BGO98_38875 [Myxococcales bacterium 68-20]|nr:DUF2089 domain-containing protein [Myxococcales bacterium]OJY26329.1 MAG: hypothetical protein BGO98_38875 [Myxococcales bacterium 68-20]